MASELFGSCAGSPSLCEFPLDAPAPLEGRVSPTSPSSECFGMCLVVTPGDSVGRVRARVPHDGAVSEVGIGKSQGSARAWKTLACCILYSSLLAFRWTPIMQLRCAKPRGCMQVVFVFTRNDCRGNYAGSSQVCDCVYTGVSYRNFESEVLKYFDCTRIVFAVGRVRAIATKTLGRVFKVCECRLHVSWLP